MLTELSALLDLLKAKGVTHYKGPLQPREKDATYWAADIELSLAPAASGMSDEDDKDAPQDMCRCGHPLAEHQGGLCMHACDEEKCS